MALAWPTSPSTGDTVTGPFGEIYTWDGEKWSLTEGRNERREIEFGPSLPIQPFAGMLWFNTTVQRLFLYTPGGEWVVSVPSPVSPVEHVLTVRMVANQGITPNTWTLLAWDTVDVDTQGRWDNSAKRYTPNVPGWYLFQCLTPLTTHFVMLKNSASHSHTQQIMGTRSEPTWFHTDTTVAYMNGDDDFINTWVHQPDATVAPATHRNELSAYRFR